MFTKTTPFKEVWLEIKKVNPCKSSIDFFDDLLQKNNKITYGEAIASIKKPSWAIWCLKVFNDQTSEDVTLDYFKKITDPMQALLCYKRMSNLSINESDSLKTKFEHKLPNAEAELRIEEMDLQSKEG